MSIENICRLCICKIETQFKMPLDQIDRLKFEILSIFGFELSSNPELPQKICDYCSEQVNTFYVFFTTVLQNQEKLAEIIHQKIEQLEVVEAEEIFELESDEHDTEATEEFDEIETLETLETDGMENYEELVKNEPDIKVDEDFKENVIRSSENCEDLEVPIRKNRIEILEKEEYDPNDLEDTIDSRKKSGDIACIRRRVKRKEQNLQRINKFIKFKCDDCLPEVKFKGMLEWRRHMKLLHSQDNPPFSCCNKKFRSEISVLLHITRVHDPESKLICAKCLKGFNHKKKLEIHMQTHMKVTTDGYKCKKCPDIFCSIRQWQRHQLIHIPDLKINDMLFPCKKCEEELPTYKTLEQHIRLNHKKKFICEHCAKEFAFKALLQRHYEQKHTENKETYKCDMCGIVLTSIQTYKKHITYMHENSGEFPCEFCDKVAVTELQLKNHMRFTHELKHKFECNYCGKLFKRIIDLEDHVSIHTGISRHICPKCDRKFNSKSNMQKHAKRCTITKKTVL
uniref:CSON001160 protein n=1 Tax=Culicoides sonorensis TaxID=179676 RepID=A0A336KXU7_CULSO